MRSGEGASANAPAMLRLAAGVQAAEAAGLALTAVLNTVDVTAGRTYQASSGIALVLLEFIVAAGLAWIASGIARVRPWSRTPAVMTQLLTGIVGVYLLQAGRIAWGVPALLLAVAGLTGLFAPPSFRALTRPVYSGGARPPGDPQRGTARPPVPPGGGKAPR